MIPNAYVPSRVLKYQTVATLALSMLNAKALMDFVNSITRVHDNKTKVNITLKRHVGNFDESVLRGGILRGMSVSADGHALLYVAGSTQEDSVTITTMIVESIEVMLPVED